LYGGRRTGKTSVLKFLPTRLGSDMLSLFVDMQGAAYSTTNGALVTWLAKEITDYVQKTYHITLPEIDQAAIERDPFPALLTWFEAIEASQPQKKFLFCIDEYERMQQFIEQSKSDAILHFLRYVMQNKSRWILLFSGVVHPATLAAHWRDTLINVSPIRVSYLDEPEARALITQPTESFPPDIYADETVDEIIRLTGCQPFLIQTLCFALVNHLNGQQRTRAESVADVAAIIAQAVTEKRQVFDEWIKSLTPAEREIVEGIARGKLPAATDANNRIIKELLEKDWLKRAGDSYRVYVELVRRYMVGEV
jgi:uncharacterized protein